MVPANSDRIPRVPPYSGASLVTASLPVRGCHPLRPAFPDRSGSSPSLYVKSYYPGCAVTLPVWALSVSIATTPDIDISFSSCRYLDVSVPCVRPGFSPVSVLQTDGLPHSDISGSIPVCSSPELFAAYHVLLRLLKPRHPPYALFRFLCCSRLEIVSFRPLLLPRYLFPILSMNDRYFSNGLQRYALFHYFQTFFSIFCPFFFFQARHISQITKIQQIAFLRSLHAFKTYFSYLCGI